MRWIVGLVSIVLTLVLVLVGMVALIPTDRVAGVASAQFQKLTGRALVIEGAVKPVFWPTLGVQTGAVRIDNADWSDAGPMLTADSLSINLDMADLMAGTITITGIEMVKPALILERARDGRENWVFGGGGAEGTVTADTPGVGRAFTLAKGVVTGGSFRFIDHGAGTTIALDAVEVEAAIPDFAGPVTVTGSAVQNGQPVSGTLTAAVFSAFTEGRVVPVTADLAIGGSTVGFDGRMGLDPLMAEGDLRADLGDLVAVAALAGAGAPSFPKAATLTAALTLTEAGLINLRGARLGLDGMALTGDADIATGGPRPRITAQVTAGDLVLPSGTTGSGGGGGGGPAPAGWPTATIDVSGLGAVDAEVALVANSVDLGRVRLGPTRVKITLDRLRAVFDIRETTAYGGAITGQFVVNGRGGLSLGGDLTLAGLAMQPLLQDTAGYDRLIGTGDLRLKFLGIGNSVDALMRGLQGSGSLSLGKGELRGLDVAGMLRTLDPNYVGEGQKTIFDGVSASFSIADGVLSNDDLKLAAPYVTATGSGTVGLGERVLDYRLRPIAMAKSDGTGGIMVPLLITGPWAAPKFRLDLESIAREKMEAEAKALEARLKAQAQQAEADAKAELAAKLQEELGIQAQEGESLQDAARRRAQEALDDEATKLLEGLLGGN
ncbi:MAG: AsmA family protein [Pseudomonadota bacterium]